MVAFDDRLPHQIFARGKMNNAIKALSSTHLQLQTKRCLQKTSTIVTVEIWTFNNYRIVFCSTYWNLTCQIRNVFINETENSSKIQALSALTIDRGASEKTWLHTAEDNDHSCYSILIRPLRTAQFTWIFVGNGSHAHKILWPLQRFLKVWPRWLQRHYERPQLFHLNAEMIVKQGFGLLW